MLAVLVGEQYAMQVIVTNREAVPIRSCVIDLRLRDQGGATAFAAGSLSSSGKTGTALSLEIGGIDVCLVYLPHARTDMSAASSIPATTLTNQIPFCVGVHKQAGAAHSIPVVLHFTQASGSRLQCSMKYGMPLAGDPPLTTPSTRASWTDTTVRNVLLVTI